MLRGWEKRKMGDWPSALVTDGALFGIKSIRSDTEHVVALDANAMDDGTDDGAGLQWFG
jgi:hypothetical protein